jgi:hypothetical protein
MQAWWPSKQMGAAGSWTSNLSAISVRAGGKPVAARATTQVAHACRQQPGGAEPEIFPRRPTLDGVSVIPALGLAHQEVAERLHSRH